MFRLQLMLVRERPLIVIYGSYSMGTNGKSCKQRLCEIVQYGNADSRLNAFQKEIVENLPDISNPPPRTSLQYKKWIFKKSNHYMTIGAVPL